MAAEGIGGPERHKAEGEVVHRPAVAADRRVTGEEECKGEGKHDAARKRAEEVYSEGEKEKNQGATEDRVDNKPCW